MILPQKPPSFAIMLIGILIAVIMGMMVESWVAVLIFVGMSLYLLASRTQHLNQIRQETQHSSRSLSKLRSEKDQLEALIQVLPDMLLKTDQAGVIQQVNRAVMDRLGYKESGLIGQSIDDIRDSSRPTPKFEELGPVVNKDYAFATNDRQRVPVTLSTAQLEDGMVLVAQDATERQRNLEQLQYDARLLNEVSDAIVSATMDGTIISWNQGAEVIYGWKADEVIGKTLNEVIATEYDDTVKQQYSIDDGYWRGEVLQKRKDGSSVDILASIALLYDHDGLPNATVAVNHDITQLKEAERQLEERVREFALMGEIDSRVSSTLDMAEVLKIGLESAAQVSRADSGFLLVMSDDGSQYIHKYGGYMVSIPADTYRVYGVTGRVMNSLQPELILDVQNDPDYVADQPETKAIIAIPIVSQDRVMGVLNLETTDPDRFTFAMFEFLKLVTTRIAAAADNARLYHMSQHQIQEYQQLYTKVSKLEQLKTDMINIASHDLRSPIGIISGYIEMLRLDAFEHMTETEIEYIEAIEKALERMEKIINDLLSLERIEQMAEEQFTTRVDLTEVVRRAVRAFQKEAKQRLIELDLSNETINEPLFVMGDATQLYEAMTNLLTNAIKYSPEGTITVMLLKVGNSSKLTVQDTGYGIPEEEQNRLFEPFFRATSEETKQISGLGLGLHLVKNIVERHKGEMIFESVYGKGSTFGFWIPLAADEI